MFNKNLTLLALCLIGAQMSTAQREALPEELQTQHCYKAEAAQSYFQTENFSNVGDTYDVGYLRCFWAVDPAVHYIQGQVVSYFTPKTNPLGSIDFDFSLNMTVDSVLYHGQKVPFNHSANDVLSIGFPGFVAPGQLDSVAVFYQGAPAVGQGFGTFQTSMHSNTPVLWTLSEPYGAKEWWPCKQSLSDKADSLDVYVKAPAGNKVAGNGLLVSVTGNGSTAVHHWHSKYPIAAYLVAFAVTNYEEYTDNVPYAGGSIPVLNYWYPEYVDQAQSESGASVEIMQLFNNRAGLYPFYEEKYGHAQFGFGGGMEHQTMSFMANTGYGLIAHEMAHQWFGDKITCGSWQHIWLNEGFATYFEGLCREHYFSPQTWYNWKRGKLNSIISQPGGSVFVPDTTNINRIFDGRLSYNKGAYLLNMLRWKLGDSTFFQGIREYVADPNLAFGYAKTAQLQAHLESVSGQNLTSFFEQWFYGEGFPTYTLVWAHNKGFFEGTLEQSTSMPASVPFFDIPVPIRVYGSDQDTTIVLYPQTGNAFSVFLPFNIDSVKIDPELWIISGNNQVIQTSNTNYTPLVDLGLRISPNPVRTSLHVAGHALPSDAVLRVRDVSGKTILTATLQAQEQDWKKDLDFRQMPPGVYLLSVEGQDWTSETIKVLK